MLDSKHNIIGQSIGVLDHGIVEIVDTMGDDAAVIEAARVSYKGADKPNMNKDEHLLRYLMRHWHTTPFEMCEIKFVIKCPLFVARQWHRHRTASINEYSARYSQIKDQFYIPDLERVQGQSETNKQGSDGIMSIAAPDFIKKLASSSATSKRVYDAFVERDIAKELARLFQPVNGYTEYYWKCNVHNLMHFLRLRMDPHAQYEIRVYADAMFELFKQWMPITAQAFLDYRLNSVVLSDMERAALISMLNNFNMTKENAVTHAAMQDLKGRELNEFLDKIGVNK